MENKYLKLSRELNIKETAPKLGLDWSSLYFWKRNKKNHFHYIMLGYAYAKENDLLFEDEIKENK